MRGPPTHTILLKLKDGGSPAHRIGVAWDMGGWFSMLLDPGVSLSWRDCNDCWLTLTKEKRYGNANNSEDTPPPVDTGLDGDEF